MLSSALVLAALMALPEPDGVVTTAPRTGQGAVAIGAATPLADPVQTPAVPAVTAQELTTDAQIDRWIASRDPSAVPFQDRTGPEPERRPRGVVSAEVGTGDYSSFGAAVSLPVGANATLNLAVSQTRNGYGYGYGPGYGLHPLDRWGSRWVVPGRGFGAFDPRFDGPFMGPDFDTGWRREQVSEQRNEPPTAR